MSHKYSLGENGLIRTLLVNGSRVFMRAAHAVVARQPELNLIGEFQNSADALISIDQLQPQVVLIDVDTPDRSGLGAILQLRAVLPQAGIIGLTMLRGEPYRQAALAAGANDLLPKSSIVTDLMPAIRHVVKSQVQP